MRGNVSPVRAGDTVKIGYQEMPVGMLRRRSENVADIEFLYEREWLSHPSRFPVSVLFPLSDTIYGPEIVYPWFLNLLPEGGALKTVGMVLKVDEHDVMGMLKAMGGDLPGALMMPFSSESSQLRPRYRMVSDSELAEIIRKLPERPLLVGEDGIHMSLAGAQDKLPVAMDRKGRIALALDGAPSTHILKPANKHFHHSVPNEAFCLRLAQAAGINAARVEVRKVEDIEFLLVERYDRRKTPQGIKRLHQEDLCQATATPPYLKYEWNASIGLPGPGIKACMGVLGRTSQPAANKLRFFEYMLFNILCGNVDAHAKNYSLLFDGKVQVMSPLYDVMNGDIYENVTKNLAMKIAGKQRGDHIHGRHWDRMAEEHGLSSRLLRTRVGNISGRVLEALPGVVEEMQNSALPTGMYAEISRHISRHCRNMIANLKSEPAPDSNKNEDVASTSWPDEGTKDAPSDDDHESVVISP